MNDNTYSGWTNYETWNWKMWIDNDYGWYERTLEAAAEYAEDNDIYGFSKYLEQDCEDMQECFELPTTGPFADLLGAAISAINWYEIAESILENIEDAA